MNTKKIKRLRENSKIEFIEKKSVFIAFSTNVKSEEEALSIIKQHKKMYADATHNVYAYVIGDDVARYSDDKEPQGTAGMPVLNSIRMSGIQDVLVIVTRYFGGILLGAGGLVRAYSTAASMALEAGGIRVYEEYDAYSISCSYSDYGKASIILNDFNVILERTDFSADVTLEFAVTKETAESLIEKITNEFSGRIVPLFRETRIDSK